MAKKWTLSNAIKKYKPHLKDSLRKNKGNINTRVLESLKKEMKCDYEIVEVKGEGRDRFIYTDKKRKEKAKKEDKRQFNKGAAPSHSKHLALMVMSKLDDMDNKARTRNGWATYFGLISPAEQDIMKGVFSVEALQPYKEYMIRIGIIKDGEEKVFQDLAYTLRNVSKGQLQTVLNQAEELKLIRVNSSWKGKVKGSKVAIDIDNPTADQINSIEDGLLKKHGINKSQALMFKNSRKTKAFNAEWLEYIENVEDDEGDAMQLQYIYEVFQIEVLNKIALEVFIKAHYLSETDSFNLHKNEKLYHNKLLDYVVENAQKRHSRSSESKNKNLTIDRDTKEVLAMFNMTEDEVNALSKEVGMQSELTPYEVLLKSDKYVDCIRNLHIQLHGMSAIDSEQIKKVQQMSDDQKRKELTGLRLSRLEKVTSEKRTKVQLHNYDLSCVNAEQNEELNRKEKIKQHKANQDQQGVIILAKPNVKCSKHSAVEDEYEAVMADIREEIREYEEKYGDRAMEHITLDTVINELTREVTVEECIDGVEQKLSCEKEQREREEWNKLLTAGEPVIWVQTNKNPLEVFQRIRRSSR
ncbi:hypothetical protein ACFFHM_20670 [Halalkalibacter kiskunsagensis]|uniref:Uncharacterized protein n=1 Tax=Halalkalibacter kiskunsagensis TaxID=1548599 RepID=A0ABV6KLW4_9BACI